MEIKKYHKIWNENNPDNMIKPGDGNVIHHVDGNYGNNDIYNLKKMTLSNHVKLHRAKQIGNKAPMYGKKFTIEHKEKLSKAKIGNKNSMYGKKHSKETKRKMSESQKGKKVSIEGRINISNSKKGILHPMYRKHHTESAKRKISEKLKNKEVSNYTKEKISNALKESWKKRKKNAT